MSKWRHDYCPLLFSLKGRQAEDSLEGEAARPLFRDGQAVHVVAPLLRFDADDAAARILDPPPGLFRGQVWAEGQETAAFAQAMPDGTVRVLRIGAGDNAAAVVDPLMFVRKPSALRPHPVDQVEDADKLNREARERLDKWGREHLVFSLAREGDAGGAPAGDTGARASRFFDLVIVMLGCEEPKVRAVRL